MKNLSQLFDLQRFEQNARLSSIINDVESRYHNAIEDDDLVWVNAAGVADHTTNDSNLLDPINPHAENKP